MNVPGFQLATWILFVTRTAQDFQPWRSTEECTMPSEQLHVEPNHEQSTALHCSSTHCRRWKAGLGLETNPWYVVRAEPSGFAELEQLHVESSSERSQFHTLTLTLSIHSQACTQATPMQISCKAWYGYIFQVNQYYQRILETPVNFLLIVTEITGDYWRLLHGDSPVYILLIEISVLCLG